MKGPRPVIPVRVGVDRDTGYVMLMEKHPDAQPIGMAIGYEMIGGREDGEYTVFVRAGGLVLRYPTNTLEIADAMGQITRSP